MVKGGLCTCSRCSNSVFLMYTGSDYGQEIYQSLPKEWMHETQFGYLCPKCAKEFQTFCKDFFPKGVAVSWTWALDYEEEVE